MRNVPYLALAAVLLPAPMGAQAGPDTVEQATDSTAIPLAPVRVTVLRTPLLLSEAPFAVTVERVEGSGPGLTLAEALGSVPGLQVDNRYNFSQGDRLSVRGFGARAQFGVRGVKVLVDGIPATLPDGQTSLSHLDPRRIRRAEVVRGPASSLWGNAAGGVIQLETGAPLPAGAAGSATALAGSHGLTHYGAEVGWGIGAGDDAGRPTAASTPAGGPRVQGVGRAAGAGRAGFQASASRLLYAGFREHAAADKRFASVRGQWTGARDAVRVVGHAVAYEAENPGSLSAELMAEDRTQAYAFNVAQATGEAAEQAQVGVTWKRAFGGSVARSLEVTGWALARELDNPIPPVIIDLGRVAAGVRASVRGGLTAGDDTMAWVVGLDAEGQWDDRLNYENDAGDRGTLTLDQAESVTTVAPFVELSAPVAGPVSALAGLRYDRHVFTADDHLVVAGDASTDDSGSRVMDQVSPSLGVTAELGAISGYVSVASSFETPTTTELVNRPSGEAGFNPELEPQRAWSVEAGVRTRARGRVRLQLAAYRTAIRDGLIPFEVPTEPGRTFFRNAGSAVHRGLELDGWAALGRGLSARLGYAWVDARFDEYVTPDGDRSGNRVPGVAPHRLTGGLTWVGGAGRLALSGRWVDAIPADDGNAARASSYSLLDLRAATGTLELAGGALEVFAGVDNVLDAEYTASVVVNAFGGRYYEPGPGRSVYAGVRLGM